MSIPSILKPGIILPFLIEALLAAAGSGPLRAQYLPVFGSPAYVEGVGGNIANGAAVAININGIAIGMTNGYNSTGQTLGSRAVKWSSSSSSELGTLGSGTTHTRLRNQRPGHRGRGRHERFGWPCGSLECRWDGDPA